jgi:RNA recognition motif-containing protein
MRIYVGNIPFSTTEQQLRDAFSAHGPITGVSLVSDRDTGQPRGFAFVEMGDAEARAAIAALDGAELGGRKLTVNEAKPRPPRAQRPREDFRVDRGGKRDRW